MTEILRRIDHLELYKEDRRNGLTPFLLLDGHQSRFDLQFLKYINGDDTKWCVCLGVPYGTALWQVADSSEQNGTFKMELNRRKKELYDNRLDTLQHSMQLVKTDIIPLVRKCWPVGFANVRNNRKAIAERGWMPYTRVLLLHETLRSKMTESMMRRERNSNIFPLRRLPELFDLRYVNRNGTVTMEHVVHQDGTNNATSVLNFEAGSTARHVSNTIMNEVDRQRARERNQRNRAEGNTARERIMAITRRLTAGRLTTEGRHYHLNSDVLAHVTQNEIDNIQKDIEKRRKKDLHYLQLCFIADEAIARNGNINVLTWKKASDIAKYLRPLKHDDDGSMPTKRKELETKFRQWSDRERLHIVEDTVTNRRFEEWIIDRQSRTSQG